MELMPENERCTAQEYVDGDSELLTCNMDKVILGIGGDSLRLLSSASSSTCVSSFGFPKFDINTSSHLPYSWSYTRKRGALCTQ